MSFRFPTGGALLAAGAAAVIVNLASISAACASPITFNTALPVAENEYLAQESLVVMQSGHDPSLMDRDFTATQGVSILGYGINGDWTVFAMLPYGHKRLTLDIGGQAMSRSSTDIGDLTLFTRYTAYADNEAGSTLRIAPLFGVIAPTGSSTETDSFGTLPPPVQPGLGAWGELAGAVLTYQTLGYEIDSQLLYTHHGEAHSFQEGDVAELDGSFQYRLLPATLGEGLPNYYLYGVLEANLVHQDENRQNGVNDSNSGGTTLFLDPGIEYVTSRWVAAFAIQVPVVQNLNGAALRDRYMLQASLRANF